MLLCTTAAAVTAQAGPWQRAVCSHGDASCDAQQWPSRSCRDCRWATPDGCDAGWCALLASCVYHGAARQAWQADAACRAGGAGPPACACQASCSFVGACTSSWWGRGHRRLVEALGAKGRAKEPRRNCTLRLLSLRAPSRAAPRSRAKLVESRASSRAVSLVGPGAAVEPSPRRARG